MIYKCTYGEDIETSLCENKLIREWYVTHLFPTNEEIDIFFNGFIKYINLNENHKFDITNDYFHEANLLYEKLKEKISTSPLKQLKLNAEEKFNLNDLIIRISIGKFSSNNYNANNNILTIDIKKPHLINISPLNSFKFAIIKEIDNFSFENDFLHEVVHLLDTNKIKLKSRNLPDPKDPKKYKEYYNSTIEFNAYTKQFIHALVNLLKNQEVFSKEINKLPQEFLKTPKMAQLKIIENILHNLKDYPSLYRFSSFINSLKIANKRKLHKEILNYFKQLI